jgi:hypothetical protein
LLDTFDSKFNTSAEDIDPIDDHKAKDKGNVQHFSDTIRDYFSGSQEALACWT